MPGRKHPPPLMSPSAPDPHARPIAPSATPYQHSLPSIRQLHPYLPPSGATQPHLPAQDSPSYGYAPLSAYAGPSGSTDPHSSQPMPPQSGMYPRGEALESDPEGEMEQPGPAKKKRRRQALSCNECKRRKIKCDRAQPCGPCTRRGEQSKCQWRTLEPVDKWITRTEYDELKSRSKAEYDELKARLDHLETMVSRIFSAPPGAVNVPLYSLSPDMSGAPPSESIPYHAGHTSTGPVLYSPAMPPSTSYQAEHVHKPPQYPSGSPHLVTSGTLPAPTPTQPPPGGAGGSGGPSHVRRTSMSDARSPTTVRQSPLSLASITSPYNTDAAQSKNYHAQTPTLPGGRLRRVLRDARNGLATTTEITTVPRCCDTIHPRRRWNSTRQWRRRVCQTLPWRHRPVLPWRPISPDHRLGGDTQTRA
ncbi:hypothetical protein JVT61DRAFT_3976 [Boletus reticuloceps]|uniref:Zn(2)-C6 fungal-type domain-containing protein n=1 Tax=Boletus reticuloceps TaxID=495285 RepID=A0A8I3A9K1_9AGAM|nr:hypothetical protein JVT61DRAFT_3976 [Boletus reticuloceps]